MPEGRHEDSRRGMRTLLRILTVFGGAGCASTTAPQPATDPGDDVARAFATSVTEAMDTSTAACDDFYQHACGGWFDKTELPPDKSSYTRSFSVIDDRNKEIVRDLLDKAREAPGDDPAMQKLGTYFTACMDEAAIESKGADPIRDNLASIEAAADHAALFELAGTLTKAGYNLIFNGFVGADAENPELNVLHLYQGGLGLPDRSFYEDEARKPLVEAYEAHIAAQFVNLGDEPDEAAKRAARILAFERAVAATHWERAKLRDSEATNNRLDRDGLKKLTPGLAWDRMFAALGYPELSGINVATPSVVDEYDELYNGTDMTTLRDYVAWHVTQQAAGSLSSAFVDEGFAFYGQKLSGQKEQRPRWKRCVSSVDGNLGHLVGRKYIDIAFPGGSKELAQDLVERIGTAFESRLPELEWMDEPTREAAVGKARAVTPKIGYPDEGAWRTYPFDVSADDHFGNVRRAQTHATKVSFDKADQPVDKREWFMNPHTVNAYYNPSANEIAFPAGILQPPFFDAAWPRAANFGAIGMVIGHELTHGFDDEGRKYDAVGKLDQWWADDVVTAFEERAECVVDTYAGFEIDGTPVNGELTLGENLADIGGARLAYRAYQGWVADNSPENVVPGLSGEQLFFVAMAQGWCTEQSPELAQMRLAVDPHSPPRYRVNGTVQLMPEFAEAFGCTANDAMVPDTVCEVW